MNQHHKEIAKMAENIAQLEIYISHLEQNLEDLSKMVWQQWQELKDNKKQIQSLTKYIIKLEEQMRPDIPITLPPHW